VKFVGHACFETKKRQKLKLKLETHTQASRQTEAFNNIPRVLCMNTRDNKNGVPTWELVEKSENLT
jgi:hypothetical protein